MRAAIEPMAGGCVQEVASALREAVERAESVLRRVQRAKDGLDALLRHAKRAEQNDDGVVAMDVLVGAVETIDCGFHARHGVAGQDADALDAAVLRFDLEFRRLRDIQKAARAMGVR